MTTRRLSAGKRPSRLAVLYLTAFLSIAPVSACPAQDATTQSAKALRQADALLAHHDLAAAERLLSSFLAMHPDSADALTLLAQVHIDQGDIFTAKQLLIKALDGSPDSLGANDALGNMLLAEHKDPEAMDRFETVLAVDLRDRQARAGEVKAAMELAISARKADRPDAALKALEHARTRLLDDPKLLLDLGMLASELGQLPEALDALNEAQKLDPQDPGITYALARVEMEQQHMPAAEADLRAYLARRPNDASAHFGMGRLLAMQQKTAEACAEFQRSIRLQPVQTESYYELGQLELDAQHDAQAEPLFQKVLARDPKHGGALTGMGILEFRRKDYAQAEQSLRAAEDTAPDYQPAHYYHGLALAKLGHAEESKRELQLAIELDRKQQGPPAALPVDASADTTLIQH